jgi:hypothetical protein
VRKRVSRVKHHIHVGDATPIFQRPRRTPLTYQQIMKEHIDELLKTGLIQPGSGAWASPVVMVKKKDGTLRFCVDYRKLNQITKKDVYPLPRIDDILDALNGAKYFSSFDFLSGYWQIEMDDLDKEKTGFITSTFQRAMDDLLRRFKWAFCLVYIDDVIVYSKTEEDHLKHIEMFLNLIEENGFKMKAKKCQLFKEKLHFLGHIVSSNGVEPDPDKVLAIEALSPPKDIKDVQTLLGLPGYYRRFIHKYAAIVAPIVKLLKKDTPFEWTL